MSVTRVVYHRWTSYGKLVLLGRNLIFHYGLFKCFGNNRLTSIKKAVRMEQGRGVPLGG